MTVTTEVEDDHTYIDALFATHASANIVTSIDLAEFTNERTPMEGSGEMMR